MITLKQRYETFKSNMFYSSAYIQIMFVLIFWNPVLQRLMLIQTLQFLKTLWRAPKCVLPKTQPQFSFRKSKSSSGLLQKWHQMLMFWCINRTNFKINVQNGSLWLISVAMVTTHHDGNLNKTGKCSISYREMKKFKNFVTGHVALTLCSVCVKT